MMEIKIIFMAFFLIATLVSYAHPSLGQKDVDDEPLVNSGREFDTLDTISPASEDYNSYMLKNLSPKYVTYLKTYLDKVGMGPNGGAKCYDDVLEEILTNKPVSRKCCLTVVKAGKKCYMETVKLVFRLYQLKRFASQVSFKTNKVWNRCSANVESPSSSHDDENELS
ncbi:protein DOWN-REGULATED IN DIF1 11-like [Brassica napus]|nr:protein DOWN-REGULATED IN DIF1 11-like [Brassica napus]